MNLVRHKTFEKHFKARILPHENLTRRFEENLVLFIKNPNAPILKDHKLIGKMNGYRSFSVGGDFLVVYRIIGDTLELYNIGTHNQVY